MNREVILACLPYLTMLLVSVAGLVLLARLSGGRWQWRHLLRLNRDQQGGVQSLSFVLTLPLFVMVLMFIVQLSQITIATVVVEYAAFAAARAAMVWIPAETAQEYANQIGAYRQSSSSAQGGGAGYAVYLVDPSGTKYEKIHFAAAMACLPICPSRNTGVSSNSPGLQGTSSLQSAYLAMSPASASNSQINTRLANKLAYALASTRVAIEVHHPTRMEISADAPLQRWPDFDRVVYPVEFTDNEYGWQDQLYVTVSHDFALLPGPGRLLARRADARPGETTPGSDRIAQSIQQKNGNVYSRTISATVRLNNEGQKSSLPYFQTLRGMQPPNTSATGYGQQGDLANYQDGQDGDDQAGDNNAAGQQDDDDPCCGQENNQDGDNREGENREGENRGGDDREGDDRNGDNREGDDRGGDDRGGDDRNGNNQAGENQEDDNRGGDDRQGDNRGGDDQEGEDRGGDNQGEDNLEEREDRNQQPDNLNQQAEQSLGGNSNQESRD